MSAKKLTGVVPIIPVPFDEAENIDEEALRGLVDFAVGRGFSAICLPAYGSEFYKLSEAERIHVVQVAVNQAAGRTLVVAQSNHISSRIALSMARTHIENGADMISLALPRQFALTENDLLAYVQPILKGVNVPCLIQDFNPGGPTVGADFAVKLLAECPNFEYLKLEEALLAKKVRAIRAATNDQVGILEGWGGLYMMELIPAGICGVMPGLALGDMLQRTFDLRKSGKDAEAFSLYQKILPQLVFALQNMELFLYHEKRLLQARGCLRDARCRNAALMPDADAIHYIDEINAELLREMAKGGFITPNAHSH
ncbi:MAG TPA: dihydrodipicolinate synthase family protein [Terriglobales bacterium]|nr:dihydrodipicolinate synthase family protein [Terriglobales bacterium]